MNWMRHLLNWLACEKRRDATFPSTSHATSSMCRLNALFRSLRMTCFYTDLKTLWLVVNDLNVFRQMKLKYEDLEVTCIETIKRSLLLYRRMRVDVTLLKVCF